MDRGCNLFMNENKLEAINVNYGIASISLFRIDILLFSKSIWFDA